MDLGHGATETTEVKHLKTLFSLESAINKPNVPRDANLRKDGIARKFQSLEVLPKRFPRLQKAFVVILEAFPFADVDGNFARLLDSLLLRRVDGCSIASSRCPLGGIDCNTARPFDAFLFMSDDVDIARIQLKSTKMCGGQFRSSCSRVGKRVPLELGLELG